MSRAAIAVNAIIFPPFGLIVYNQGTPTTGGGEHASQANHVLAGRWHRGGEAGEQGEGVHVEGVGAIGPRALEGQAHTVVVEKGAPPKRKLARAAMLYAAKHKLLSANLSSPSAEVTLKNALRWASENEKSAWRRWFERDGLDRYLEVLGAKKRR
jgi:hypothetical protein